MAHNMMVTFSKPKALDPSTFIEPPDWVVRLVSTNQGKRCRKYPSTWSYSSYPSDADDYYPFGSMGPSPHHPGNYEHWREKRQQEDHKIAVKGNLKEEAYRFWNGSACAGSEVATCRWCRHWAYGPEAMRLHQSKTDHTRLLREIYDLARKMPIRMCFCCHNRTSHERWGIPLCNTNKCLNRWRVAPIIDISHVLLVYARLARGKGLLKEWLNEDGSEKRNLEANPKSINWERANVY